MCPFKTMAASSTEQPAARPSPLVVVTAIVVAVAASCMFVVVTSTDEGSVRRTLLGEIFPGKSLFADQPPPPVRRQAAARGTSSFFGDDRGIFSGMYLGMAHAAKGAVAAHHPHHRMEGLGVDEDNEGNNQNDNSTDTGNSDPSSFLKGIVKEVEDVDTLPKKASARLEQSEHAVMLAKKELAEANVLRDLAEEKEGDATVLEDHLKNLEEVAAAKNERANWFDERAQNAKSKWKEEIQEQKADEEEREKFSQLHVQKQRLRSIVRKVSKQIHGGQPTKH